MKAALVGGGLIGGGWAARFLLNGWDVSVFDPDPESERKVRELLDNAKRSLPALYDKPLPKPGTLKITDDLADCINGTDWIQESIPERLELKQNILSDIQAICSLGTIIGSSTSGFKPSSLQEGSKHPEQILVAHPFNPVYLLPLVEIVPSSQTSSEITDRAQEILSSIGMKPLLVRKEIDAHIADRLLESVWREGLWLINDGIATTEELDDAIRFGFGLRWSQMGLFETYRVAGGEGGMNHFLHQFTPSLKLQWSRLMDVPEFNDALINKITTQSDKQSGHFSIQELERIRDDNLVGILRALKKNDKSAGKTINNHENRLTVTQSEQLPITVERLVPATWTDYNGHMNEAHYLEVAGQATDVMMEMIGCDAKYIESGNSYFTVETHICHLNEVKAGQTLRITTQVINGSGKKLHLFHRVFVDSNILCATAETLLIHVDLKTRKSSLPLENVANKLKQYETEHANFERPEAVGRFVGQRT